MAEDLLGEQVRFGLTFPERPSGYLLLLISFISLVYLAYSYRGEWRRIKGRQWLVIGAWAAAAILLPVLSWSLPFARQNDPSPDFFPVKAFLTPLGSIAWLSAAAMLNPAAALLIGFITGLARALFQTHQLFTPIQFAIIALASHLLLQRHYVGRVYAALRHPLINGLSLSLAHLPLFALSAGVSTAAGITALSSLDIGMTTAGLYFWPLLLEGLIAGSVVWAIFRFVPDWQPVLPPEVGLPWRQHITTTLVRHFALFSLILIFIAGLVSALLSISVARELVISQMAQAIERAAERVEQFIELRQDILLAYSQNEGLTNSNLDDDQSVVRQLFDSGDLFNAVLLVGIDGTVRASEPGGLSLTPWEQAAIPAVAAGGPTALSQAQMGDTGGNGYLISFITPISTGNMVLVGRVDKAQLDLLAAATDNPGLTFVTDGADAIIADPLGGRHTQAWKPNPPADVAVVDDAAANGTVYEEWSETTGARQLVYYQETGTATQNWRVVMFTPYDRVWEQALPVGGMLAVFLFFPLSAYGYHLVRQGRRITQPIISLSEVAGQIAQGSLDTSIRSSGDDEVGQLAQSFEQMRRSLKKRLDELSLLLSVSQNVSTSMDITQSLQAIIASALQATKADGARIIMSNPGGRMPLQFGEGAVTALMEPFDRTMMRLANQQQNGVLILRSRQQIRATLSADKPISGELPISSLIAIPMHARDRYRGVFWLGYTNPHEFSQLEINFLTTLAGQASVVAENTLLFANAEGGRRRLLAVLSSTSDAVIVTDQTDRVILINPAMEKAFGVKATVAYRRQVKDVLNSVTLLDALTKKTSRPQSFELTAPDERVYLASVSGIRGDRNEFVGRVAVLRDITAMKELNDMKSELVRTVSHDLRGPLAYMRGYATMLPTVGEINDKQHYYLNKIVTGVDQMTSLVEGILNLRRLESGIEVMLEEVRPEQLLENVALMHEQDAEKAGLNLVTDVPTNLPYVQVDRSLMQQALSNLVGNAIKYARESGPLILSAAADEDELVFSVQDRGPGIPAESIPRLFDEFYRVQQRGSEHVKGAGLGLSLVQSIAKRHGGRAWCHSQLGEGSTFYVSIPLNGHSPS